MPSDARTPVLVIEDTDDIRMMVRTVLELEGFEVREADDGEQGLAAIDELAPAADRLVVLLDVHMPSVNGWSVLEQIRERPELDHVAVVLCTVKIDHDDRAKAFALGGDGYLAKPFDLDDLAREVERLTVADTASLRSRREAIVQEP